MSLAITCVSLAIRLQLRTFAENSDMTPWTQNYDPCGNIFVSALLASLPIFVLLGLLGGLHVKAHYAAIAGLLVSLLVAMGVFKMPASLQL